MENEQRNEAENQIWKVEKFMDNREKILQCALELFYARGYDAVGVQEIAERAGVTKPTLYHYFGSKYGLLRTLLKDKLSWVNDDMREAAVYQGDVSATLYQMAFRLIDIANANRKMYMLMMALFYSAKENEAYQAVRPIVSELFGIVVHFFEEATPQLGNIRGRQEQFALGFLGTMNQYILHMCEVTEEGSEVTEEQKRSLVDQFMYGIHS
jgi:AcrR family transcriptional regulator